MSEAIIWDTIINSYSQSHPFTPWSLLNAPKAPSKKSIKKKQSSKSHAQDVASVPGVIHLKNSKPKYQITDISGKLASRDNVTLEIGWNVQPWVGALTWTFTEGRQFGRWKGIHGGRSEAFEMPALKGKGSGQPTVISTASKPKAAEATPVMG